MHTTAPSRRTVKREKDRSRLASLRLLAKGRLKSEVMWLTKSQREQVREFISRKGWRVHSVRAALAALHVSDPGPPRRKVAVRIEEPVVAPTPKRKQVACDESQLELLGMAHAESVPKDVK